MQRLLLLLLLLPSLRCTSQEGPVPPAADSASQPVMQASFRREGTTLSYGMPDLGLVFKQQKPAKLLLGKTNGGRDVEAWFFPGLSDRRALVIGGMHGSELSSTEMAHALIRELIREQPYYSVMVIPSLFPDNAAAALRSPGEMGSVMNIGRYSHPSAVDPNRQMPSPGRAFDPMRRTDHLGRPIEKENCLLLELIQYFQPSRIANLHAIRNTGLGGIYADPRTDHRGFALGYDSDSSLAIEMARLVHEQGGNVGGNMLEKRPNALYYKDPTPAPRGQLQKRNMTGSALNAHRGSGVSMGTWGTTAIQNELDETLNREAMRVITVEFPGSRRSIDYPSPQQRAYVKRQIVLFARAIHVVFLGNFFTEDILPVGI